MKEVSLGSRPVEAEVAAVSPPYGLHASQACSSMRRTRETLSRTVWNLFGVFPRASQTN